MNYYSTSLLDIFFDTVANLIQRQHDSHGNYRHHPPSEPEKAFLFD